MDAEKTLEYEGALRCPVSTTLRLVDTRLNDVRPLKHEEQVHCAKRNVCPRLGTVQCSACCAPRSYREDLLPLLAVTGGSTPTATIPDLASCEREGLLRMQGTAWPPFLQAHKSMLPFSSALFFRQKT